MAKILTENQLSFQIEEIENTWVGTATGKRKELG
jgi:hypothetical protein